MASSALIRRALQAEAGCSAHRLPVGTRQSSPGADLHPSERSLIAALCADPVSPEESESDAGGMSALAQVALGISVTNWILGVK